MKDVYSFRNKESISIKHLNTVNMSLHLTYLNMFKTKYLYKHFISIDKTLLSENSVQVYIHLLNIQTKTGNTYEYNYKHGLSLARCGAHCCTL